MKILYILLALVVLLVLITVHEFGHYCAGKLFGFKINEFSIGFGPAIFKRTKKDGEIFSIRAFPLGGYCAFEGEDEDTDAEKKLDTPSENSVENDEKDVNEQDKETENKEVQVKDDENKKSDKKPVEGSFNSMAAWKRLIVLLAGVTFNFLFAILTSTIYLMVTGFATPQISATISQQGIYTEGFKRNDIIVAVNGKKVEAYRSFSTMISKYDKDEEFKVTVERDGKNVEIKTKKKEFPAFYFVSYNEYFENKIFYENGDAVDMNVFIDKIISQETSVETEENAGKGEAIRAYLSTVYKSGDTSKSKEERGTWADDIDLLLYGDEEKEIYACITYSKASVGIGIIQQNYARDYSFFESVFKSVPFAFYLCKLVLVSLVGLLTGAVSVSEAGGTITAITQMAQISRMGIEYFLLMVPLLSANLALFNVLPIPSLDGARSIFVLIEMIFKKPVPRHIEGLIHTVGLFILLGLVVFLDINHFLSCRILLQL